MINMSFEFDNSNRYHLINDDCIEAMKQLDDNSIDSVVTDPPYGLGFMGKKWDSLPPSVEVFEQCLRVLKPGGHLLAFGGSRTYHRLAVAVEDSGFEIRDQIMWVYSSGFPKSQNISKFIDKTLGKERTEVKGVKPGQEEFVGRNTKGHMYGEDHQQEWKRPWMKDPEKAEMYNYETYPASEEAEKWDGWGTALKPAHEPIVVARKPIEGTVAKNVMAYGTGGLNIDECRIETGENLNGGAYSPNRKESDSEWVKNGGTIHSFTGKEYQQPSGRWPANFIHDGSDEVEERFPDAKGQQGELKGHNKQRQSSNGIYGSFPPSNDSVPRGDSGSASRFFYCSKAPKKDRTENGTVENKHPTVKPNDLMKYLCRLITPKGGVVLDPFMGSGSTGKAALQEEFYFIGIDYDEKSCKISEQRLQENTVEDMFGVHG